MPQTPSFRRVPRAALCLAAALLAHAFAPSHARAAPAPTAADADAPLPPPPDGYTPVQDMDEAIIAHSPAVLAHTGPGLPGGEAQQITRQDQNVPSHFSVFGLPIKFNAPVPPPYNAEFTYRTFGGQPGNGRGDATAAWGTAGEP